MRTGWLAAMAVRRQVVVHLIAVALLLPLMIGLLPQPVLSATEALDRDIAMSTCVRPDAAPAGGQHHDAALHDCCILCAAGCAISGPALSEGVAAFAAAPRIAGFTPMLADRGIIVRREVLLDGSPPRGPPTLS